jgi:hypothetical protein
MAPKWNSKNEHRRRGSVYVVALGTAMVVTAIGLSAVAVARINVRNATAEKDLAEAGTLAFSGMEHALVTLERTDDWRTLFKHGVVTPWYSLGRGEFNWMLLDELDGDLANNSTDPVVIVATGIVNDASYRMQVELGFENPEAAPKVKDTAYDRWIPVP